MAKPFQSEAMRGNMAESLARRPSIALGSVPATSSGQFDGRAKLQGACVIDIDRLVPDPDQPRKTFSEESLDQLASSMATRGQLVPILARWTPEADRYTIVDGERRYRAALRGGLTKLAAVDVTHATVEDILEIQLVTNALRDDVAPVEQARAYRRLMDSRGYTHRALADRLNIEQATVTRALALLNLPETIQTSVDAGEIRPQTAYELSKVDDPTEQAELAEEAKAGRLKRDDIRGRVASKPKAAGKGRASTGKPKTKPHPTEHIVRIESGHKITVTHRKGFDLFALLETLRAATAKVEEMLPVEVETDGSGEGG